MLTQVRIMAILPPPEKERPPSRQGGRAMRPLMAVAQLVFALSCTLQGCGKVGGPGSQDTRGPRVGQLAPEIDGKDLDGQSLKLSDFRGKVVLLSFYGEWCHYCVKQFPHELSLVERFKN